MVKEKWPLFAMGALCLTLLISHTLYVIKTHQFPAGGLDEPIYLSMALNAYDSLRNPSLESISEIINFNRFRQPLYGVFLAIPLLIFGTAYTYKISLWMNIIFYLTTVIATYFLGREFLSKRASFLSAFIFAFYGFPLFYLHFTYSETAVTSFIVLSLFFLAKSKNFSILKNTVLFSIFFALGNLVRWVVPIFVGGPLVLSFMLAIARQVSNKTRNIRITGFNVGVFLLIGILPVLVLFYIPNFSFFSSYISAQKEQEVAWASKWLGPQLGNLFSIQSITFYLKIFAQQTIFFFGIFVLGFILGIIFLKRYAFLVVAFVVAYSILTFSTTWKGDRFIVPIYPLMAIISAITFDHVWNNRLRGLLIATTLIIGSLNFFGATWGIGPMKFSVHGGNFTVPHSILIPMPIGHPRRVWLAPISWPPRPNEGNAYEILKVIGGDWKNQEKPFRLLQTFEMNQVGDGLATIFSFEQREIATGTNIVGIPKERYDIFFERIRDTDYIIVKDGIIDKGNEEGTDESLDRFFYFVRKFNKAMQLPDGKLPEAFIEVNKVPIPFDKSTLVIYRKQREITKDEWDKFAELFILVDPESIGTINSALGSLTN